MTKTMTEINILRNAKIDTILLINSYFVTPGDVVFTAEYFKGLLPEAKITFTMGRQDLSEGEKSVITRSPFIDEFMLIENAGSILRYLFILRKKRFDLAVVLLETKDSPYARKPEALAYLIGAKSIITCYVDNSNWRLEFSRARQSPATLSLLISGRVMTFLSFYSFYFLILFFAISVWRWKVMQGGVLFGRLKKGGLQGKKPKLNKAESANLYGEEIVCFSSLNWNELHQRPHCIMSYLSKGNRILYIGAPVALPAAKGIYRPLSEQLSPQKINRNLYTYYPIVYTKRPAQLFLNFALIDKIAIILQIKYILYRLRFMLPIVYICTPRWGGIEDAIEKKIYCYDCFDKYDAFPHLPPQQSRLVIENLIRKADLVFATAESLYLDCKKKNTNAFLVPNAVDIENFIRPQIQNITPSDISCIPKPIIGYHGAIAPWLDLELIEYIAARCQMFSIVLIGPVDCNIQRFKNIQNVYFLGRREFTSLPYYLEAFDVGIIPFKINDLTLSVNPIKLYEYLCLGKPVVSVDLPEVRKLAEYVKIALSKEEFVSKIMDCLQEKDEYLVKKRIEFAFDNNWKERTEGIAGLIKETLDKKEKRN